MQLVQIAGSFAAAYASGGSSLAYTAAAVSAAGAIASGVAQSEQNRAQARIADRNADLSDKQSEQVLAQGVEREQGVRMQADQQLGAQRAAISQSGFNASSGSALDVQTQSAGMAELDALQTRYQGLLQGDTLADQANQQRYQASVSRTNAKTALTTGILSAAGSALTGYAQYARLGGVNTAGSNAYAFQMPN